MDERNLGEIAITHALSACDELMRTQNTPEVERKRILLKLTQEFPPASFPTTQDLCRRIASILADELVNFGNATPKQDRTRLVMACLILLSLKNVKLPQFGEEGLVSLSF